MAESGTWSGFEAAKTAPWPSQGLGVVSKQLRLVHGRVGDFGKLLN